MSTLCVDSVTVCRCRGLSVPVDGPVPWKRADHTGAKHDIYRRYLERWFPILLRGTNAYKSATYAEGFAGPGVYEDDHPGSPIIAIQALLEKVPNPDPIVKMIFIDDDVRCTEMLREQLTRRFPERPRSSEKLPIKIKNGTCAESPRTPTQFHERLGTANTRCARFLG
ncbi:three-Cys-motif partner protein TcmP [Amycolatopsis antarctica]|uniref:three-Cys-motif partner protein TcmP n=1 Tax=Amycolatopsis antarctica TaxID=1854586 RepID=UPI003B837BF3